MKQHSAFVANLGDGQTPFVLPFIKRVTTNVAQRDMLKRRNHCDASQHTLDPLDLLNNIRLS